MKIQQLRGIVFHDQQAVTAADVLDSLNQMQSPELNSPGTAMFSNIVGFKDYRAGVTDKIAGVYLLGEHGVEATSSTKGAQMVHDKIEDEAPWVPLYNHGANHIILSSCAENLAVQGGDE